MGVGPAHCGLDHLVQPVEPDLQRHLDLAHRLRINIIQDDPEAGDEGHAAILCAVRGQFHGSSSGRRDMGMSGSRARTSASQA